MQGLEHISIIPIKPHYNHNRTPLLDGLQKVFCKLASEVWVYRLSR